MPKKPLLRAGAGITAGLALALAVPLSASAHDVVTGSNPAPGSTVSTPLTQVTITFAEAPQNLGGDSTLVEVTDRAGRHYETGTATVDGLDVRQAVDITTNGTYTINYRIVADDGHPVSTAVDTEWPPIVFTVKLASVAPSTPGSPSAAPSGLSGASTPSATPTPSASTGDVVGAASQAPGTLVGIGLGGAAVIVAAIITIVVIRRNRRR